MITECPNCNKAISAAKYGITRCPKCGALVFIGDPLKNEKNSVVDSAPKERKETDKESEINENIKSYVIQTRNENPKDIEYIKRSRFNSKADELKIHKDNNPNLVDEVVQYLNMDIEFYQCFQLN